MSKKITSRPRIDCGGERSVKGKKHYM